MRNWSRSFRITAVISYFEERSSKTTQESYAVFTEQGSSAPQMTAAQSDGCHCRTARLWWTSSRRDTCVHPGRNGGRSKIAQNSKVRVCRYRDTSSTTYMAQIMANQGLTFKSQWYHLNEINIDTHWQDCCEKDNSRKFYWNLDGKNVRQIGNVWLFVESKDYSFRYLWMTSKWLDRWKKSITWDVLNVNANRMILSLRNIQRCLNHIFLLEQLTNNQGVAWSHDMEGHARKCAERYCVLVNKKVEQLYKVSSPCLDYHQFKKEELESVGESSKVCSQIVLTCLYLARIGRPDIYMVC